MFAEMPVRKVVTFNDEAAWTPQERTASVWQCYLMAMFVGIPSVVVAGASLYCNICLVLALNPDSLVWLLAAVGITLFVIGLPIARPLVRRSRPDLDRSTFWLWVLCLTIEICATCLYVGINAAPHSYTKTLAERQRLQHALDALPAILPLGNAEADVRNLMRAREFSGSNECHSPQTVNEVEICQRHAEAIGALELSKRTIARERELDAALRRLPPPTGFQWGSLEFGSIMFALIYSTIIVLGSALGMPLTAEAINAILRYRSSEPITEVLPPPDLNLPPPLSGDTPLLSADAAFTRWFADKVSIGAVGHVTADAAYSAFLGWCSMNSVPTDLLTREQFGRLMNARLSAEGLERKHSNGSQYPIRITGVGAEVARY